MGFENLGELCKLPGPYKKLAKASEGLDDSMDLVLPDFDYSMAYLELARATMRSDEFVGPRSNVLVPSW